jgi:predicted secreted Zn-dependent protease
VRNSGILQATLVFLLLMTAAISALAAGNSVEVASLDTDIPSKKQGEFAPPVVTEKHEYYEVTGCSEKELQSDLGQNCVTWNDGKQYDSITLWDVSWDHGYDRKRGACSTHSFRVTLEIIFRYPKWRQTDDAPPQLKEKWDRYLKNLVIHENGHRDMVVKGATELTRAVAQLPPASSCAALDREVNALYSKYMEKLEQDQYEYDKSTNHGTTQGAIFP